MADDGLKSYLFVIDSSTMSRDDAMIKLDEVADIVNWQKILPDAAILVSGQSVKDLHNTIRSVLGDQRYIITKLDRGNKNGWLAKDSWEFMNNPKSVL